MPQKKSLLPSLFWAPLALAAVALSGCAAPAADDGSAAWPPTQGDAGSDDAPADAADAPSGDIDALLDIERAGVAVLADQWINNDCSVELALSPDDLVCAVVLDGADLTTAYDELGGGLGSLDGDAGMNVRLAFEDARDAGAAWAEAGCAETLTDACADEAETLISTLLVLDTAFDAWAA